MNRKTTRPRGADDADAAKISEQQQGTAGRAQSQLGAPTADDWHRSRVEWEQEQRTRRHWLPYARSFDRARRGRPVSRADLDVVAATLHRRLDNCAHVVGRMLRRLRMEP